jgi:hypothetical protein
VIGRRSLLLAGAAFPASAYGQCVINAPAVDACLGGVRNAGPAGATLDLNFMFPGSLDPRITFSRASTATYTDASGVIQTAAVNAPRWDYAGGSLRGLLIEEARTNLQFPTANWGTAQPANGSQDGWVFNAGVSPTGANNALALIPGAFSGVHQYFGIFSGAISTAYGYSVYAKAAGMNFLYMELSNSGFTGTNKSAVFNLSSGTIDQQDAGSGATIRNAGNGWYRCLITATSSATGSTYVNNLRPGALNNIGSVASTGNNVDGVWVFGQQVEAGAFGTSLITTTSGAASRSPDNANIPVNVSWFNPAAMSIAVAAAQYGFPAFGALAYVSDGGSNNRLQLATDNTGRPNTTLMSGGVLGLANSESTLVAPGANYKYGASLIAGQYRSSVNGATPSSFTTGIVMPVGVTNIGLGNMVGAAPGYLCGWLQRVVHWPRALSATELQQVTT